MLVEREVDAKLLLDGDLVKALPGAKIPADGIVGFGTSRGGRVSLDRRVCACAQETG